MSIRRTSSLFASLFAVLVAACAGSTAKLDPAESALGNIPGRWENAFVEVQGAEGRLRMHYVAAGRKDAPRLILLHGFPDFAYTWRELVPMLSRDYRVIAPDLRGYAATGKPKKGYDLDTLAADVLAFADATAAVDEAPAEVATHLLGHDWGSVIGWWSVMKAPTRFSSFTAISVAHPRAFLEYLEKSPEQRKKVRYMRTFTLPGVPTFFAGMSDKKRRGVYASELVHKEAFDDDDLVWYRAAFDTVDETRPPLRYYKQRFRDAEVNEKTARDAAKISIPVLVLWGEQDKHLMWRMAADSCKYVQPGLCRSHVFADAGHWPHWDNPKGVVEQWRAFVEASAAPTGEGSPPTPASTPAPPASVASGLEAANPTAPMSPAAP